MRTPTGQQGAGPIGGRKIRSWASDVLRLVAVLHPAGILLLDTESRITWASPRARALLDLGPEGIGRLPGAALHLLDAQGLPLTESQLPQARVTVAGRVVRGMRYATTRADGSLVLLRVTGAPRRSSSGRITRILLVLEDISREAVMESHLARTQQIQAAGILASGLVHDFNNELTVIKGSAELLRDTPPEDPERAERLGTIAGAADRCASLAQRLLKYCRRQKPEVEALDVNQVVGNLAKPLARVLGGHIALTVMPAATESCIAADPVMLEGAILNLAINARDAMADGGRLKIETRTVCGGDDAAGRTDAPDRPYVMLIVSDTGKGMDLRTRQRAFDPFFTTKAEGTGLGLAMVRNFVRETGGFVSVKSEPGKGTTFRICLPCLPAPVASAKAAVAAHA